MTRRRMGGLLVAAAPVLLAAAMVAGCGSSGAPTGAPGSSVPQAQATPAAHNATDVAFTRGMLALETQSNALAALVPGHTTTPQLRQYTTRMRGYYGRAGQMREWMRGWHQSAPPPYTPGAWPAGTGPGMMGSHAWDQISRQHGHAFDAAWSQAMISNHAAAIAWCRAELRSGVNPQARALARGMLPQWQAGHAQLQHWYNTWQSQWHGNWGCQWQGNWGCRWHNPGNMQPGNPGNMQQHNPGNWQPGGWGHQMPGHQQQGSWGHH